MKQNYEIVEITFDFVKKFQIIVKFLRALMSFQVSDLQNVCAHYFQDKNKKCTLYVHLPLGQS